MAITYLTAYGDVNEILGAHFGSRASVLVETNTGGGVIIDEEHGTLLLGKAVLPVDSNGIFTTDKVIAFDSDDVNPSGIQYRFRIQYLEPDGRDVAKPATWSSGWLSITEDNIGDGNIANVLGEQLVPPDYHSNYLAELQGIVAAGQALLAQQEDLSGIATPDATIAYLIANPSATKTNLSSSIDAAIAAAADAAELVFPARILTRAAAGSNVIVSVFGDSVPQGSTASNPGTNDAVSIFCNTLASRYSITVTKHNEAQGGRTSIFERIDKWSTILAQNPDLIILGISGKNDGAIDVTPADLTGYPRTNSLGEIQDEIRTLMFLKPNADIMILSGNPYGSAFTAANAAQKAYSDGLAALAKAYGLPYADGWNALRVAGQNYAADSDLFESPSTHEGVHPNTAGYAKMAAAMTALIPAGFDPTTVPAESLLAASPPPTATKPWYRDRRGVLALTASSFTFNTDRIIPPAVTGTWTGTGPWTSTTAASQVTFMGKASEVFLKLTLGVGQGVCDILVNGRQTHLAVNLANLSAGKWISEAFAKPGVNYVTIVVVSGSVTVEQIAFSSAPAEFIDANSSRITVTGAAGSVATATNNTWGGVTRTVANTTVLAFSFVGTGFSILAERGFPAGGGGFYWSNAFYVDGVLQAQPIIPSDFAGDGSYVMASGLEYGVHTVSMTFQAGLLVGGFSIFDERAIDRPYSCQGIAKVGETVRFPYHWTLPPTVDVTSTTADDAVASTVTADSCLLEGTSGDVVYWRAESGQRAIY